MLREQDRQTSQEMRFLPPAGHLGAEGSGGTSPGGAGVAAHGHPPPSPTHRPYGATLGLMTAVSENQPGKA